jgi:PDZ-binding kinase
MDLKSPVASAHTIHIPSSPFMLKLGCGTGVSVYRYKRSPEKDGKFNSPWAIKKSNTKASDNIRERLAIEASVLKQIGSHPYIVGFRAFTGTKAGELCLAMEDCERSLMDMIEEHSFLEETFTADQILKVAWCVSNALKFLHNTHKLLHGDIKSANVLVRGDFDQVKLCDFGVSLRLKDDLGGLKNKDDIYIGSEPWTPKEVFNSGTVTDRSDIYPFGLLLWEMLSLSVPHLDLLGTVTQNTHLTVVTLSQKSITPPHHDSQ